MAEIILEPTVQSKVIPLSIRLNDTDTSLVSQLVTNRQFSTADTDAWFSFTLEGLAATTGTFDLALINLHDKSVFNHTDKVFNTNPFYYKLDSGADELTNEIRHAGKWVGQLVVTLANGDSATRKFIFGIEGHILDGTVVQTILLEDYNALIASIESAKDELTQYNIDYASLIGTVTEQEAARLEAEELRVIADELRETKEGIRQETFEANEVIRDGVVDSAIEGEMIAQTVATKLTEKEATFAPRMLSLESQLADKAEQSALLVEKARIDSFTTLPTGSTTGDAELIDTRIGVDGVIYPNAGGAVREQLGVLFDTLSVDVVFDVLDNYIAVGGNGSLTGFIGYSLTSPMPCYFEKFYINDIFSGAYDVYSIGFYSNLPCDNTTFISGIVPSGIVNGYEAISVPLGANYMVFCAETSVIAAKTPYMFVPNNSTQSDIKALSSVNAAHAATFFDGVYLNEYGTKSYGLPWYSITEKIFLVPSLTYELDIKLAWGSFSVIAYFDADDAYIGSLQRTQFDAGAVYLTKHQITIPANCSYAIFTVPNDGKSTLKMTCGMSDFLSNVLSVNKTDDTLIIPKYIDVVKNHQCTIYRDCMVEYEEKSDYVAFYTFPFNNNAHSTELKNNCLSFTPTVTGEFDFRVMTLSENTYKVTSEKTVTVRTTDKASESTGLTKNIMMCGDSLIDANVPVDEVFNLLRADGDYTFNAIGTRGSAGSKHEGRGSWKWDTYLTQTTASGATNAFLYNGSLDFQQYCIDNGFDGIDYAIISLGTNDIGQGWHLLKDAEVATIIANAKTFLDALLSETTGFPNCKIALGLPAIGANTFGNPNMNKKWFIRGMQKLNKAYIDTFDNGTYHPNVTTVAHGLWTDREYSYLYENQTISNRIPETVKVHLDAIHPTVQGYKLWADAYYGKLRAFLAGYL